MKWWARRRLRAKIFLPFSALIVAVLLATLWVIGAAVGGWVEGSLKRQFNVTGNVFHGLMAERAERLVGETTLLAKDYALTKVIVTYDPDTLSSVAGNLLGRIGGDLVWITDENGLLFGDSSGAPTAASSPTGHGLDISALAPLKTAMDSGEPAVGVTEVNGRLMQLAAVPVSGAASRAEWASPNPMFAYLLAGEAIDDDTARQLEASTGPAVSFLTPTHLFATSLPSAARDQLFPAGTVGAPALGKQLRRTNLPANGERSTFLLELHGERWLSILIPIEAQVGEPLFALVQGSYDRALGPLAALTSWVGLIGAAALLGALLVGGMIAGGIAAPVQDLVAAMRRVLTGDFGQRLTVRREDEIGFLAGAFNEMVAGLEEREKIKETFGRFVSRDVATAVLSGQLPLDGERREVTILFQDVRGFTTLAEHTEPPALVRIVNGLFTEMVAAVEAEGGIIRVFTGDGVMALFGAPVAHADAPVRAVRAALDMVARLPALSAQLEAEGLPALRIGVGIATGDVIVGRMGPDARSEYNVVGDAANLASRIEGLNKELQTTILVSAATAARLGDEFEIGRRAVLPVKGKELPVEVVEVLGCAPGARRAG